MDENIGELHAREAPQNGDIAYDREMWEKAIRLFQESLHHDPTLHVPPVGESDTHEKEYDSANRYGERRG